MGLYGVVLGCIGAVWGCIVAVWGSMGLSVWLLWTSMLVEMVLYVGGKVSHGGGRRALMGLSWGSHEALMGLSLGSRGALMWLSWGSHGASVAFSWSFRGAAMGLPRGFHVAPDGAVMGVVMWLLWALDVGLYGNADIPAVFGGPVVPLCEDMVFL